MDPHLVGRLLRHCLNVERGEENVDLQQVVLDLGVVVVPETVRRFRCVLEQKKIMYAR